MGARARRTANRLAACLACLQHAGLHAQLHAGDHSESHMHSACSALKALLELHMHSESHGALGIHVPLPPQCGTTLYSRYRDCWWRARRPHVAQSPPSLLVTGRPAWVDNRAAGRARPGRTDPAIASAGFAPHGRRRGQLVTGACPSGRAELSDRSAPTMHGAPPWHAGTRAPRRCTRAPGVRVHVEAQLKILNLVNLTRGDPPHRRPGDAGLL